LLGRHGLLKAASTVKVAK